MFVLYTKVTMHTAHTNTEKQCSAIQYIVHHRYKNLFRLEWVWRWSVPNSKAPLYYVHVQHNLQTKMMEIRRTNDENFRRKKEQDNNSMGYKKGKFVGSRGRRGRRGGGSGSKWAQKMGASFILFNNMFTILLLCPNETIFAYKRYKILWNRNTLCMLHLVGARSVNIIPSPMMVPPTAIASFHTCAAQPYREPSIVGLFKYICSTFTYYHLISILTYYVLPSPYLFS